MCIQKHITPIKSSAHMNHNLRIINRSQPGAYYYVRYFYTRWGAVKSG